MYDLLIAVTDLGDSFVLAALALFCGIYMLACGCKRGAAALVSALLLSSTLIGVLKLIFLGCRGWGDPYHIHSPSGHAALSSAVYGTFALLLARQCKAALRYLPLIAAGALVAAIAVSRVLLGLHSVNEVWVGLVTGSTVLTAVYFLLLRHKTLPAFSMKWLAVLALVAIAALHGMRSPAEAFLDSLIAYFHTPGAVCGS